MPILIVAYNPAWPSQFELIKAQLIADIASENAEYLTIEHIGSTSVPGLVAKPIIDIVITTADADHMDQVRTALRHGGYQFIGDGGVKGRWSFKLYGIEPARTIYLVNRDSMLLKSWRDLRDTLRVNSALRDEYGRTKLALAEMEYHDIMEYSSRKDKIVRKILETAGWSKERVDEKEGWSVKSWKGFFAIDG